MHLTQTDKLEILAFIGGHPDNESLPPMEREEVIFKDDSEPLPAETWAPSILPETSGPRFPYSAIRDRIKDYAPPVPRCYGGRDDGESADDEESTDDEMLEETLRSFVRDKQGREVSGDVLPSARNRGAIRAELASMGCTWGE